MRIYILYLQLFTIIYKNCEIHKATLKGLHLSLTFFCNSCLHTSYDTQESGWWIGWDYAHCDDYCGYMTYDCGIKHTTKEIQIECFNVIEQLIKVKSKN